jgi:small nuclear ribonucleoprotein (snRNP)-like protein
MKGKSYERSVIRPAPYLGPDSPIEYVRSVLGRQIAILLTDERELRGQLLALDQNGNLALAEVTQRVRTDEYHIPKMIVPIGYIERIETCPQADPKTPGKPK